MLTISQLQHLFAEHNIRPDKRLGQNFLIDQHIFDKIVAAADLSPDDQVVEVGSGVGNLTMFLAPRVRHVVAVEKSRFLLPLLEETLKPHPNTTIVFGDILDLSIPELLNKFPPLAKGDKGGFSRTPSTLPPSKGGQGGFKLVANIPYNITGHLLRQFLDTGTPPSKLVLLVQRDVAERLLAEPPDMNLLACSVRYFADVRIEARVSPNCFWPAPQVDSSIIVITPRPKAYDATLAQKDRFFQLLRAGYSQKRKQVAALLATELGIKKATVGKWLADLGLSAQARAQEMLVIQWLCLAEHDSIHYC
ncbi:ribosomal RNA small subunit methyltransferase A [Candidatus Wirthbacteria bacterium CG2_30_54_11]|uniref:Ribosomal RNA small subunit methyltransferase A n=1 Tax=Candidatus Wirthbacteria bacterium CG2_30_54_11 TaxID=1817892 RepID=A0A1J5J1P2_9BACT|nr:MAG: ribosomal RNA small subunit methyltransferase A [Candidatus Wirthbacteria bacterium CG2_30_54_11]